MGRLGDRFRSQRTLYAQCPDRVRISRDGSFLASLGNRDAKLWSITQGTLLATFDVGLSHIVFSRTNRLYVAQSGGGRIYDMPTDPNNACYH